MKKIFLQIIFVLFLCVNAYSDDQPVYVELICAPDTEWEGMASKSKRIWFPSFQPKFFIHMDLKKMKVVKIGYSKDEDEIRDVSIPIEKKQKFKVKGVGGTKIEGTLFSKNEQILTLDKNGQLQKIPVSEIYEVKVRKFSILKSFGLVTSILIRIFDTGVVN